MKAADTVRPAHTGDIQQLGEILGDAFCKDPGFNWAIPHPPLYPRFFSLISRQLYLPHNEVYIDRENRGAALWLPPGVSGDLPISLAQMGLFARLVLKRGPGTIKRALQAQATMARYHPREPHYYLHAIGACSRFHGQGVGSALLKTSLMKCDWEGVPAYLEASTEDNARLYQRHGFETFAEDVLGPGGPLLRFMWREPREVS